MLENESFYVDVWLIFWTYSLCSSRTVLLESKCGFYWIWNSSFSRFTVKLLCALVDLECSVFKRVVFFWDWYWYVSALVGHQCLIVLSVFPLFFLCGSFDCFWISLLCFTPWLLWFLVRTTLWVQNKNLKEKNRPDLIHHDLSVTAHRKNIWH